MHSNYEKLSTKNYVKNQKWGGKALLFAVILFSLCSSPLLAQSPFWLLPEKHLDFTGPILTLPAVTNASAYESPKSNIAGSNAWFDQYGAAVFFLSHNLYSVSSNSQFLHIYKGNGDYVDRIWIQDSGTSASHPHPESLIIPKLDNCKEFFLVVSRYNTSNDDVNIDYYTLDTAPSTWTLTFEGTVYSGYGETAMAVSKPNQDLRSYLYIANLWHIVFSEVSSTGISQAQTFLDEPTIPNTTDPIDYYTLSLDVSSDGSALAWGTWEPGGNTATVYRAKIDPSNGSYEWPYIKAEQVAATGGRVTGVEFHYKYSVYVFATVGTTTGTLSDGIVRFHFDDNSSNPVYPIQGTEEYAASQIETGYNRTVVVAGTDHLRVFNSGVTTSVGTISNISLPNTPTPRRVRMLPMYINGYGYPAETGIVGPATVYLAGSAQNNPATYSVPFSYGMTYSWSVTPAGNALPDDEHRTSVTFPQTAGTYTVTVTATSTDDCMVTYIKNKVVTVESKGDHQLPPFEDFRMMANSGVAVAQVYPNPAAGSFAVATADGMASETIRLYDLTGREVKTYRQAQSGQPLSLSGLPAGVYMVHIRTPEGATVQKLIVSQ